MKLLALILVLGAALQACGPGSRQPQSVSLAALTGDPAAYEGALVTVSGRVAGYTDDPIGVRYYVLQDGHSHRVELVGSESIAAYAGRDAEVTGTFHLSPDIGRNITVTRIALASTPSPS